MKLTIKVAPYTHGEYIATVEGRKGWNLSGFGDTDMEAIMELCHAIIGACKVELDNYYSGLPAPGEEEIMKKREWVYAMEPRAYEMTCDLCGGADIAWSEFEGMLWCYACEKDTPGTPGIFDGPIPLRTCGLLGISFDRINLATGERLKMAINGDHLEWVKLPDVGKETDGHCECGNKLVPYCMTCLKIGRVT